MRAERRGCYAMGPMRVLVTGSSGHLGEALVRVLGAEGIDVVGLDVLESPHTSAVGSIADRAFVRRSMSGVDAVLHAATLHKPHVGSHTRQDFVDTNLTGTLNLLEESVAAGVRSFVFTSTTSAFGRALSPGPGEPAAWIDEDVAPVPRNIVSATTPFTRGDLADLRADAPAVVRRLFPDYEDVYAERGWSMFPSIDRVYDNTRARVELGWSPRYDFRHALDLVAAGEEPRSELAVSVGMKGYHDVPTGVYTVR